MTDFDCIHSILAPLPPVEYPTVKRKRKADAVAEWLRSMGLDKYEGSFVDNGYDDLDFLGDDVIDGKALEDDLGVVDEGERDAIMEKVKGNRHVKGKKSRENNKPTCTCLIYLCSIIMPKKEC